MTSFQIPNPSARRCLPHPHSPRPLPSPPYPLPSLAVSLFCEIGQITDAVRSSVDDLNRFGKVVQFNRFGMSPRLMRSTNATSFPKTFEVKIVVGAPLRKVIVQEAVASNATWVVLNRHLKMELRFYLKQIPCNQMSLYQILIRRNQVSMLKVKKV